MSLDVYKNVDLKPRTWWKAGGSADHFCEPKNLEEVKQAFLWSQDKGCKVSILGGGTNVLVSDKGIKGLVISTSQLIKIEQKIQDDIFIVEAESGVSKASVMACFKKKNLAPALFLSGLPGDVGGGVVMNAGAGAIAPCDFSHIVKWIDVCDEKGLRRYKKQDLKWNYRSLKGWGGKGLIFRVGFSYPLHEDKDLNFKIKQALKKRRSTQPLHLASCGSVFKNPYPQFAGELIEKAGLKGLKKGSAMISEKHANFIVNLGSASAQDIHYLIQTARRDVKNKFNIQLEPEVRYLGSWDEGDL